MKYIAQFMLMFLFACSNSHYNNCSNSLELSQKELSKYYANKNAETTLNFKVARFKNLITFFCNKVDSSSRFIIIEDVGSSSGGQEGLFYLPKENKTFYYKWSRDNIKFEAQKDQLNDLKKLSSLLDKDFTNVSKNLLNKTQNIEAYDVPRLNVLLVDKNTNESGYFEIQYVPNLLDYVN